MSISVNNLSKKYHHQKALNNLTFEVQKGEIMGFLGPNGAGKSTMMKIITGYISPSSGSVFLNGLDIEKNPIDARMLLGYLPEQNPLYGEMYIREYLSYVAGIYKLRNKSLCVNNMIELTGLEYEQNKKIKQLSKGFKQRVGIAQALIHDPEIIILDEPTTGLDPNQLVEIRKLIKRIGSNKTLMLSTHIMQEVDAMCDRVIILNKGEIVADSNELTLFSDKNIVDLELIENVEKDFFQTIPNIINVNKISSTRYRIESDTDVRKDLFHKVVASNYTLIELRKIEQNLESVFNDLTSFPNSK